MITDSCNCERSGHGCKGLARSFQATWCSVCDRNKVKRRCQSEGLYQEGDPLKELNWCCDRGCDLLNRSSKCSSFKKTELEVKDKKINYSDDNELEGGDNCYGHHRKHHSRFLREMLDPDTSIRSQNSGCDLSPTLEKTKTQRLPRHHDSSPERCKTHYENSNLLKYHPKGDHHDILLPSKTLALTEKERSSSELRDIYLKEMEILRSKLNLLKDGMGSDGKRLRQRSESEPGFAELPGSVPKRARDNSPKMKMTQRKLPISPNLNQSLQKLSVNQEMSFQRESKSLSPSSVKTLDKRILSVAEHSKKTLSARRGIKEFKTAKCNERRNVKGHSENKGDTDNDNDSNNADDDDGNDDDDDEDDDDDDNDNESVESNSSSGSSDSNTPSKVGECLGSITLNEVSQYNLKASKCRSGDVEPVPNDDQTSEKDSAEKQELFRTSLFPNVPPYVKFFMHDFKGPTLPSDIRRHLKWRLSSITPIIIRKTLLNSGFKLVRRTNFARYHKLVHTPSFRTETYDQVSPYISRFSKRKSTESNDWTGQWGKHMKSFVFKTLKDFQKLNHFPGTFQIGRKDRLWKNLYRLMLKFGKKEFGFIPKTYILPHDRKMLRTAWEKATGPGKGQWIVKPPAAARGTGIRVVHRWGQIPKKKSLIVQKYIAQPYLINGSKFDLRLYVLMTSIHPLRIYLYDDGLVRFASVKYSDDVECLSNRFMHLTNYSINKLSNQYQVNEDASSCHGHKWSLKSLWTYLAKEGVNVKALRKNLTDLVIKTIISGESNINMLSKNNLPSRYCSYELFGIDVLLDHTLKPWLLEVNISPSLHSASPLDLAVKGPLVKELLNIAGFQIPAKLSKEQEETYLNAYGLKDDTHTLCYDKKLYWMNLSKEEKSKQEAFQSLPRKEYLNTILENLTPDDVRHLVQFEDELTQLCRFEKIFPTSHTHAYHQFFESPRYYNMMLDAWETKYHKNREEGIRILSSLCQDKVHLTVPISATSSPSLSESSSQPLPEEEEETDLKQDKMVDGDDVKTGETVAQSVTCSSPKSPSKYAPQKPHKSSVVSKPLGISTHLSPRRSKAPEAKSMPGETEPETEKISGERGEESPEGGHRAIPLQETCIKVLAEMRQNGLKQEKLKQFSNCKLENSIVNESLNSGKSVLSPTKHIHNACIKMNTTS